ncbi:hypothetical protein [Nitrosomonas sp. Nm166]|uniref:hypothetical protein n=1 Tax=Nitrosomonas sp. Nm166 TaxID=1881054 RepID=UPI0008E89915|nr:hypothetical protein [Nitrosomonas sp. Nm166]SFE12804.1 hypothetical protein SAMN05428977_100754 [Nitrosomonas sp. Nm166]
MSTEYKGYNFIVNSEQDEVTKQWNGRYRILDQDGIVVYESFVDPVDNEDKASSLADKAARVWIDKQ